MQPAARIRNILVPIDFSQRSLETVAVARTVAKKFGANLHLAHIYDRDFPLTTVMAMPLALPPVEVAPVAPRHVLVGEPLLGHLEVTLEVLLDHRLELAEQVGLGQGRGADRQRCLLGGPASESKPTVTSP